MLSWSQTSPTTPLGSGLKRKASTAFVPDSLLSFLAGSLDTDFGDLQLNMDRNAAFDDAKKQSPTFIKQLFEELFRYLYLLAADNTSVPSHRIELAHRLLLLDPVLYFHVCDRLLRMHERDDDIRLLPHDPLDDIDANRAHKKAQYINTLVRYQRTFGQDPPPLIWASHEPDAPSLAIVADGGAEVPQESYQVKLRLTNHHGDEPVEFVVEKYCTFAIIMDQLRHRYNISSGEIRMFQNGLLIKPYMTPWNLNLRDGHEISCSFPFRVLPVEITFRHVDWKEERDIVVRAESADVSFGKILTLFARRVGDVFNKASSYEFKYNGVVCYDFAATLRSVGIVDSGVIMCRTKHHTGPERTIVINFRDQQRYTTYFTVMPHTLFQRVLTNFVDRYNFVKSQIRVRFQGESVQCESTIEMLELEDGDSLDVYLASD